MTEKKTIKADRYTVVKRVSILHYHSGSKDTDIPLYEMNEHHLLNALIKAERDGLTALAIDLKNEVIRRMK